MKQKLNSEQDGLLRQVFMDLQNYSKPLGTAFFKTVHLYNHINTQFESLKEFHKIEDKFRKELIDEIDKILKNVKDQKP